MQSLKAMLISPGMNIGKSAALNAALATIGDLSGCDGSDRSSPKQRQHVF